MPTVPHPPTLEASGLVVRRGGRALLDHVDIKLAPGRVTAGIGPNGAGKSTLLRVLAGELMPEAGQVIFAGAALAAWPAGELARCRAVLPQESDLRFPFTVEEVVLLGRIPHAGAGETAHDRRLTLEALAAVDLVEFADRSYPTLSGGERQRVHLARALAQLRPGPDLPTPLARTLLLDEPTASLDLAHQHGVLALAGKLARDENVAVLAVLHDLNLVLAHTDDLVVLQRGRVAAAGPVETTLVPQLVEDVFGVSASMIHIPGHERPRLFTQAAGARRSWSVDGDTCD